MVKLTLFRDSFFRHNTDVPPANGTFFLIINFFSNTAGMAGTSGTSQLLPRFRVANGTGTLFFELSIFQEKHFNGKAGKCNTENHNRKKKHLNKHINIF